jgi:hypothetical protein
MSGARCSTGGSAAGSAGVRPGAGAGDHAHNINPDTRASTQAGTSATISGQSGRIGGAPPATRPFAAPSRASPAGTAATNPPDLIQKVSRNSATVVEMRAFEQKYMQDASFQLLAYRQLKKSCNCSRREQAVCLDLAMHPPLVHADQLTKRRHEFGFLDSAQQAGEAMGGLAACFHPAPGREEAARQIFLDLIEQVASSTATAAQMELFCLKWEFDCFAHYADEQRRRYLDHGPADKAHRLSDAVDLAILEEKLMTMKGGGGDLYDGEVTRRLIVSRGLNQAQLLMSIACGTATTAQRQSFARGLTKSDWFYSDVLDIQRHFGSMFSPQEKEKGARLERELTICDMSLIERVANKEATKDEAESFVARLEESEEFQLRVARKDRMYRSWRSSVGYEKAAELRVAVERADIYQAMKDSMMDSLESDPHLAEPMQVARRNAARARALLQATSRTRFRTTWRRRT